ncbi:hypothetical protein [Alteromonas sp. a30]|uniref:hypothetical protein n=1 Tax=Alteromonas sp. a30 TaxID=2730917 RepID=UPI002281AE0F|nr:hypothetical protein [Alteromonas sp. a30]MCY7297245.1 hypothetical protein [Alteromonas sp. a30]
MLKSFFISHFIKKTKFKRARFHPYDRYVVFSLDSEAKWEKRFDDIDKNGFKCNLLKEYKDEVVTRQDITSDNFEVIFFSLGFEVHYKSLFLAYIQSVSGYAKLKLHFSKKRIEKISGAVQRESLITALLNLKCHEKNTANFEQLFNYLYGVSGKDRALNEHKNNLRWKLDGLVEEKVIELQSSEIKIKPKALNELSKYQLDERRHRDSRRLTKAQIFLGACMFFAATINIYFSHFIKAAG